MQRVAMDGPVALGELSDELCLSILEYLPASALKRLSETSRRFYNLSIPVMYHTIDLGIHYFEPVYIVDKPYLTKRQPANWKDILIKQHLFINLMLREPQYASLVRSFTWNLGFSRAEVCLQAEFRERVIWLPEKVYAMFSLLDRATSIDIDMGPWHSESLASIPLSRRPLLFPDARHIRLGGKMHYALASAILHGSDKAPLSSLSLNNVQEGGLLASGENFHMGIKVDGFVRSWRDLDTFKENWPEGCLPIQVKPGNMRRC